MTEPVSNEMIARVAIATTRTIVDHLLGAPKSNEMASRQMDYDFAQERIIEAILDCIPEEDFERLMHHSSEAAI
jgi:hypothetical protein